MAAATLVVTACNPHFGQTSGPVQHAALSSAGDRFEYSGGANQLVASAPATNVEGNVREFFWSEDGPNVADQQACNTWVYPTGNQGDDNIQPGLAMRIAPSGPDGEHVKGITVHENVWSAAIWILWVDIWDSSSTTFPYTGVKAFDVSPVVGKFWIDEFGNFDSTLRAGPWHVCARTQGLKFTFKVWVGDDPEPTWDDPIHVYSTTLPEGWNYSGYSGGYIGHLDAGESETFTDITARPLCLEPDMFPTEYCQPQSTDPTSTTTTGASTTTTVPAGSTTVPPTTIATTVPTSTTSPPPG